MDKNTEQNITDFKDALERNSMTPREFANTYDITERAVQYWISGERPIPAWAKIVLRQREMQRSVGFARYIAIVDFRNIADDEDVIVLSVPDEEDKAFSEKVRRIIMIEREKYRLMPCGKARSEESADLKIKWLPIPDPEFPERFLVVAS